MIAGNPVRHTNSNYSLNFSAILPTSLHLHLILLVSTIQYQVPAAESMHLTCKVLLLLVKHRPSHVRNLMDIITAKLCCAAAFCPLPVSLHSEQVRDVIVFKAFCL